MEEISILGPETEAALSGLSRLIESGKKVFERHPENRNYSIEVERETSNGGLITDIVLTKEKDRFHLSTLLPKGWQFYEDNKFGASQDLHRVHVFPQGFLYAGSVLVILHEIVHAKVGINNNAAEKLLCKFGNLIAKIGYVEAAYKFVRDQEKQGRTYEEIHKELIDTFNSDKKFQEFVPEWLKDRRVGFEARNERRVWMETLRTARVLEKAGWNVLSEIGGIREVRDFIDLSLESHEWGVGLDATSVKITDLKYKPRFVKTLRFSK